MLHLFRTKADQTIIQIKAEKNKRKLAGWLRSSVVPDVNDKGYPKLHGRSRKDCHRQARDRAQENAIHPHLYSPPHRLYTHILPFLLPDLFKAAFLSPQKVSGHNKYPKNSW